MRRTLLVRQCFVPQHCALAGVGANRHAPPRFLKGEQCIEQSWCRFLISHPTPLAQAHALCSKKAHPRAYVAYPRPPASGTPARAFCFMSIVGMILFDWGSRCSMCVGKRTYWALHFRHSQPTLRPFPRDPNPPARATRWPTHFLEQADPLIGHAIQPTCGPTPEMK